MPAATQPSMASRDPNSKMRPAETPQDDSNSSPLTLESGVGFLQVTFEQDLACFTTAQPLEIRNSTLNLTTAAKLLGLSEGHIISDPVLVSCGLPYHLIDLDSLEALRRARPSPSIWQDWVTLSGYEQIYLCVNDKGTSSDAYLRSRMFSTAGRSREYPATGRSSRSRNAPPRPVALAETSGRRDGPAQPDLRRGRT